TLTQLLKEYDLSTDEIEHGVVDGRNDGGIDAWYTILDGALLTDADDVPQRRGPCSIDTLIFSVKHHDTFKQDPVVALYTAVTELFDLTRTDEDLSLRYNDEVLGARAIFKFALIRTARGAPQLRLRFHYVSRGDVTQIG